MKRGKEERKASLHNEPYDPPRNYNIPSSSGIDFLLAPSILHTKKR